MVNTHLVHRDITSTHNSVDSEGAVLPNYELYHILPAVYCGVLQS